MKRVLLGIGAVVLLVLAGVGALLYPPESEANPSVAWTPSALSLEVGAGQSTAVEATFTPSVNATNVSVGVVPELAPYVSVSPSSFAIVEKGLSHTVTVTASASSTASLGLHEGTLHLKQGKKTLAKPLPIGVEVVWPTFLGGEELGFALQYPPGWVVDTRYANRVSFSNSDDLSLPREDLAFFRVLRMGNANPSELPIDQWFDAYFSLGFSSDPTSRELVGVAGRDAVRITYIGIGTHVEVYVPDGVDVLNISYNLNTEFLADYDDLLQSLSIREMIFDPYPEDL